MGFELKTLLVIGTDYIGSYKSNYHMITTTTVSCNGGEITTNKKRTIDHGYVYGEFKTDIYFFLIWEFAAIN